MRSTYKIDNIEKRLFGPDLNSPCIITKQANKRKERKGKKRKRKGEEEKKKKAPKAERFRDVFGRGWDALV